MNAKQELLNILKDTSKIKCADIHYGYDYGDDADDDEKPKHFNLKLNYTDSDLEEFLKELDFDYDSGYGGQELFGTVWLEDGTWLSRGEYDGSEWWDHNILPTIPEHLIG